VASLSNVPAGPFSFPRFGGVPGAGGVSLTSTPFRPSSQVVGSPQNAVNLAAARLPQPAVAAAPVAAKPAMDPRLMEMLRRMQMMPGYNQAGGGHLGSGAAGGGYSSSSGRSVGSQGLG
jgi:hypothetical protein